MTLTQLGAFVLVARLGSVRAAADTLGVSEPAVSKAIASLRHHLGDPLLVREGNGMRLTEGGTRLIAIASQMVSLAADAEAAVAAVRTGGPTTANLHLVVDSMIAEFIAAPLTEAFTKRRAGSVQTTFGVATSREMRALVSDRLADIALGPMLASEQDDRLISVPLTRYTLVIAAAPGTRLAGPPSRWPWLIGPSGADPGSDVGRLLRRLRVPDRRISVFGHETAAWAAAADGAGVVPAVAGLIAGHLRRGELFTVALEDPPSRPCWYATTFKPEHRTTATTQLLNFLTTPDAMQIMCSTGTGVPPSRLRPPVYVTIWS
ncbi:MAG TPA: LysR family transcriptional regulator [Candidatus Limnocylindrales bacterium]|nr:LysR family transcriptional regulator [Candidatus Limnocylindrales bacterium]